MTQNLVKFTRLICVDHEKCVHHLKNGVGSILEILPELFCVKTSRYVWKCEKKWKFYVSEYINYKDNWMNEWITKVELCELQSDLVEYWVLSVWLWVDCLLSVSISIACTTLLVEATPGSLATPNVSALQRSCNFLIRSADVVLGLFDSLDSALFAWALSRCFWRILLLYLASIAWFVVFLSIFNLLLLITFKLQNFVYLCSCHFTKLRKFYTYV
jgi:hypothetical protein